MQTYRVQIAVRRREGVLDPESAAIVRQLTQKGFAAIDLYISRLFDLHIGAESEEEARELADNLGKTYFSNPNIERYEIVSVQRH